MTPQYFKDSDATEKKFDAAASPILSDLSLQRDLFLAGAYSTAPLGDMVFETGRSPLSNAIAQDIFRLSFTEIFESFVKVGTFESYITVFKKIFGDTVNVVFTIPAPGKLQIAIHATIIELNTFVTRYISGNAYFFDDTITQDSIDTIVFQSVKGFASEYDLDQMLFEMVPAGIFTQITLTLGA